MLLLFECLFQNCEQLTHRFQTLGQAPPYRQVLQACLGVPSFQADYKLITGSQAWTPKCRRNSLDGPMRTYMFRDSLLVA